MEIFLRAKNKIKAIYLNQQLKISPGEVHSKFSSNLLLMVSVVCERVLEHSVRAPQRMHD